MKNKVDSFFSRIKFPFEKAHFLPSYRSDDNMMYYLLMIINVTILPRKVLKIIKKIIAALYFVPTGSLCLSIGD